MTETRDTDLIYLYSRAQAIEDGVLIDVSSAGREAGFTCPVAVTASVWGQYVEVPDAVPSQDEAGRLWDILSMLRFAISGRNQIQPDAPLLYRLIVRNYPKPDRRDKVTLKAIYGPGDTAAPVMTIMLPDED